MVSSGDRSEIAFFDVETSVPTRPGQGFAILEFGAILVCPKKLVELESYSTLVRPIDLSLISSLSVRCNGITRDAVVSSPSFGDIADRVYDILQGRIWAGHNILRFDCARIREAFAEINRKPPEPKGTIDSLALLTQRFGRRAGDMKMATLATYFGLGQQTHRSLDDVRMNLEVLKYCATVLFLESSLPDIFTANSWVSPNATTRSRSNGKASLEGTELNKNTPSSSAKVFCAGLKVRFGMSTKFVDYAGRPRFSFVVDASPSLCRVLDKCDNLAQKSSGDSGSNSEWRPVVARKAGFLNSPTIRLHLPTVADGDVTRWITEIYQKESSTSAQKLVFSRFDVAELDALIAPGALVDAYFSIDTYDYQQNAGIRLVAKKLVVHSS
ncbi:protein NEN1 isoform X2 [Cornus florida]|uniref:protein NEN1 isoform X2 n=1 Tax=Cornus florida TaxID=4283 RepID=UPI0028972EA2|nr:protein NEN1 isoform X2 [Cornus florida]